jgi:5-formyltetrahydrofolate cyclo-ligase
MFKSTIRKRILEKRNSLSNIEISNNSSVIQNRIVNSSEFKLSNVIAAYFPTGSEVRTQYIMYAVLKNHKVLALPRTERDEIVFCQVSKVDIAEDKLISGRFGIKEPAQSSNIVETMDLLIVPGLAFDRNGYRLGYGKGYYDRFIANKKSLFFSMGLAFEFQLLDNDLPRCDFDQKIDAVTTEKRTLVFSHASAF